MKRQGKITAIFDQTLNLLAILAVVLIVFIMLAVGTDVVMRYFFSKPMIWVGEISEYSLLFITFLGAAWLLRNEGHVRMDLVLNRLGPRAQAVLNLITSIISAIVCLIIVFYSARATLEAFQTGYFLAAALDVPMGPLLLIIPIGTFLLFIQFLRRGYGYLQSSRMLADKE